MSAAIFLSLECFGRLLRTCVTFCLFPETSNMPDNAFMRLRHPFHAADRVSLDPLVATLLCCLLTSRGRAQGAQGGLHHHLTARHMRSADS